MAGFHLSLSMLKSNKSANARSLTGHFAPRVGAALISKLQPSTLIRLFPDSEHVPFVPVLRPYRET